MKDHEIREAINELNDIALKYRDSECLREAISTVVHVIVEKVRIHELKEMIKFRESESNEMRKSRDKHIRHKCAVRSHLDSDFQFLPPESNGVIKSDNLKVGDEIVITGKEIVCRLNSSRYSSKIMEIFECCGETIYKLEFPEYEDIILNKYQDEWEII